MFYEYSTHEELKKISELMTKNIIFLFSLENLAHELIKRGINKTFWSATEIKILWNEFSAYNTYDFKIVISVHVSYMPEIINIIYG